MHQMLRQRYLAKDTNGRVIEDAPQMLRAIMDRSMVGKGVLRLR